MNKELLFDMLSTPSVSGCEIGLQKKVYSYMKDKADSVLTDENGNVISAINTDSSMKVLLAGHIDEIGLFVSGYTSDGFLKVRNAGGIYVTTYLGHKVRVYGKNGMIYGAVLNTRELSKKTEIKAQDLLIDIGADSDSEAKQYVDIGDIITFDTDYRELLNDKLCGRALDDRIGAFIVIQALLRAKEKGCKIGVYSATTVGEETTRRGAFMAAARVKPTMAIAVDVTYASDYDGGAKDRNVELGKGPVLCYSPLVNRKMNTMLKECAKKIDMNIQLETELGETGTDGDYIAFSGEGIPMCLVSIPLRYMHNPNETASFQDIKDCIELISEFLCTLTPDDSLNPFQ